MSESHETNSSPATRRYRRYDLTNVTLTFTELLRREPYWGDTDLAVMVLKSVSWLSQPEQDEQGSELKMYNVDMVKSGVGRDGVEDERMVSSLISWSTEEEKVWHTMPGIVATSANQYQLIHLTASTQHPRFASQWAYEVPLNLKFEAFSMLSGKDEDPPIYQRHTDSLSEAQAGRLKGQASLYGRERDPQERDDILRQETTTVEFDGIAGAFRVANSDDGHWSFLLTWFPEGDPRFAGIGCDGDNWEYFASSNTLTWKGDRLRVYEKVTDELRGVVHGVDKG